MLKAGTRKRSVVVSVGSSATDNEVWCLVRLGCPACWMGLVRLMDGVMEREAGGSWVTARADWGRDEGGSSSLAILVPHCVGGGIVDRVRSKGVMICTFCR